MSVRVRQHNGSWSVYVQSPRVPNKSGRLFQKIGPTEADRLEAEEVAAQWRLIYDQPKRDAFKGHLVREIFQDWKEIHWPALKPSTQQTQHGLAQNHILPAFGDQDIRSITRQDLMRFANQLSGAKSPAVVKNALSLFRKVVNLAIESGMDIKNPAARIGNHVRRLQNSRAGEVRQIDSWSAEEALRILELAAKYESRIYPGVLFALHTGARRGEILGLQWKDIDLTGRRAHIRRGRVKSKTVTPKSGRDRFVALSPMLLQALQAHREAMRELSPWATELWVFPTHKRTRKARGERTGQPMQEKTFREAWLRLKVRFGGKEIRPLVFHATRHTFATLSLEAGKSVKWVAEMLGHADPSITLRIYAHAIKGQEADLSYLPGAKPVSNTVDSVLRVL